MSFFGFDPSRNPGERSHPTAAPGFSQAADPFAGLDDQGDDDDGIDFEDTYDGLGDQLDESGDAFNDDTFGVGTTETTKSVGKDFDFFGRTAKVSDAIQEEQMIYARHQPTRQKLTATPPRPQAKPKRTGYEIYKDLGQVSDLQVDPTLWGDLGQASRPAPAPIPAAQKKMMSLEEVEEQMRAQKAAGIPQQQAPPPQQLPPFQQMQQPPGPPPGMPPYPMPPHPMSQELPASMPRNLEHGRQQSSDYMRSFPPGMPPGQMPRQMNQMPPQAHKGGPPPGVPHHQARISVPGFGPGQIPQSLLMQLPEEERQLILQEQARQEKRNQKIEALSKHNGLMTPQDKNFITRIQLQQLMAASGNANDQDPAAALDEDFYYQVHNQIRGGPRHNPNQPLNHFAQTYLFQLGGRNAQVNRRHPRGGDNHAQRMEQQVLRAVEAAKLKPKNKQLTIEGSLGKISMSNSKTPRTVLNIKRRESSADIVTEKNSPNKNTNKISASDRKSILTDIERIYSTLMKLEDMVRREPNLSPNPEPEVVQAHMEWRATHQALVDRLWQELKVMEPINPGSSIPHPFISILSYPKGKKVIPRVIRHLTADQRLTLITMIVLHLDILDVVRNGVPPPGETHLPAAAREAVDLFSATVTPALFSHLTDAPLYNIIGLLGLLLDRVALLAPLVARTRVGLAVLTTLTSRATLLHEAGDAPDADWAEWQAAYNRLFDTLEPVLGRIFPGPVNAGEDMYVWQFLAAMGSGASPEQQQRLVIGVKDRVMETVTISKTLPPEMASQRLGNVNLFMRAIGLDVELLG